MSDGHFNRCLLPHTPFADGLKAGKAQMRAKATEAFAAFLTAHHPDWDEARRAATIEEFRRGLTE